MWVVFPHHLHRPHIYYTLCESFNNNTYSPRYIPTSLYNILTCMNICIFRAMGRPEVNINCCYTYRCTITVATYRPTNTRVGGRCIGLGGAYAYTHTHIITQYCEACRPRIRCGLLADVLPRLSRSPHWPLSYCRCHRRMSL